MKLIDEQRALSFDIWPDPTIGSVTGYYCVFFVSIQCFKLCLTIVHPISRYSKITVTLRLNARCLPIVIHSQQ